MIRTRDDFYQPGFPAQPGEHYGKFIRFAQTHVGNSVLDLGCGFVAYSTPLMRDGLSCVGCDINFEYLRTARGHGLLVVNVDSVLPFADDSFDSVLMLEVLEHVSD